MEKIGILGGTFDPIHMGHLIVAEEARWQLHLNEVLFVPARLPWMKSRLEISAPEHRLQMLRLALSANPAFRISELELQREGISYTVDTLRALRKERGEGSESYFILGWDALANFWQWKEPSEIIRLCRLVAVGRPGSQKPSRTPLAQAVPGIEGRVIVLETPQIGISSTELRRRAARGLSLRYLVPEAVEKYIREQKLYKKGKP